VAGGSEMYAELAQENIPIQPPEPLWFGRLRWRRNGIDEQICFINEKIQFPIGGLVGKVSGKVFLYFFTEFSRTKGQPAWASRKKQ